jgi:hypothetical protein
LIDEVEQADSETIVSYFHQDVFKLFANNFPVVAIMNDYDHYIEKDILVTEILDPENIQESLKKDLNICIEINGIHHYP